MTRTAPENPIILIPARLAATRLPGKPLADIAGTPMIVHVWRRAVAAEVGPVVVACGDRAIADVVEAAGGRAVLTDPHHPTGSDRIHEAIGRIDPSGLHDAVVNVQGDLPLLDPAAVRVAVAGLADPETDIATLAAIIEDEAALADTSVNKVVAGFTDPARPARALYFSKAVVPWGPGPHYEHIGLYAYRRAALERFVATAARRAGAARASRTAARARGRHAHLGQPDRRRLPRRAGRHAGRPRPRPPPRRRAVNAEMTASSNPAKTIAFQGALGAYSDLACRRVFPEMATLPCNQFEDAFAAVREHRAALAMMPIENSVAGRVADIHHLMPDSGLHIIGEHFERVNHHLLALPEATLATIRTVRSHVHALSQCRKLIRSLGLDPVVAADTAGAAAEIAERGDPTVAAIASELAGQIYGLVSLKENIEDAEHNTTRFLIMSREPKRPPHGTPTVTTFLFRVRNVPAALYKAMGGFATNGVNMTKLESYMVGGAFSATQFYADVEAHPEDRPLALALEELAFFSREVKILGVYPAHPLRIAASARAAD